MRALLLPALALMPLLAKAPAPPRLLSQTGLYAAPGVVAARNLAYAPQYPLWTDGAAKARWIHLPAAIDGRDEAGWVFPVGTKAWKEFAFGGRKVETRLLWKTGPRTWVFASYAWNEAQTDAGLVPEGGRPDAAEVAPGLRHAIPSRMDCRDCHGQERVEVLGFTALQLSPDRDPNALHGEPLRPGLITLDDLVARRLLRGARPDLLTRPPRLEGDPATRTALGYLQANCATCHRADRPIPGLGLDLRPTHVFRTALVPGSFPVPGQPDSRILSPGHPERSALLHRLASRNPVAQMPPLGTVRVDQAAVDHLRRWIADLPVAPSH
ncbi:c-type cytochrome domain-containing protein [Geothrix oryzisoli]|uniref:c-type cytochrome domain-containing protein n=1 Tax=Geothrix oryzisoli TaxID=2922721 RepID=UPI001FAB3815|nr:c-type cytochrome domain-containing protein [Geothrix oryzisoli]